MNFFIWNLLYPYVKMEFTNKRKLNTFVLMYMNVLVIYCSVKMAYTVISYVDLNIQIKNVQLSKRNTT